MILIFDCSLTNLTLGISQNNLLVASKSIALKRQFSKFMVWEVEQFLKANASSFKDIKIVYFTNGPGSFTSVRLGMVFAKTLAICYGVKLYTIDSLSAHTNIKNGWFKLKATNKENFKGEFVNHILTNKILLTADEKESDKVENIALNMLKKINFAKRWNSWKDVKIAYVKKI